VGEKGCGAIRQLADEFAEDRLSHEFVLIEADGLSFLVSKFIT
jgi:hypothetical protein